MPDDFPWPDWQTVIKLDPDKQIADEYLAAIVQKKVDAVVVGGTQGITMENTARLIERIKGFYAGPLVQEISESRAVVPGADGYIIPVALNAADRKWIIGAHLEAIKTYSEIIDWRKVLPVGYIVCNPRAAVAAKTRALPVSAAEAAAYATLAAHIFRMPAVYIEYSGAYGDPDLVRAVRTVAAKAGVRVFYGGGIDSAARLKEMSAIADTVVIGNVLYEERDLKWL